jgi:hypothetical protein
MSGSFQTATHNLQAPGIAGDFASANPRAVLLSSQYYNVAGFKAGPLGLTIGLFCWADASTRTLLNNFGAGAPDAFVGRQGAGALITTYLNAYGMTIPAGFQYGNAYNAGDFFVVNNGTAEATPGMKAYANNVTGVATFAATGAPTQGGTSTASTIAPETGSSASSTIVDNLFTTGPSVTGTLVVGGVLSGTNVASGTVIQSQVTPLLAGEVAGGVGRYIVSPRDQTVTSTTISETYGLLTVGGSVAGTFAPGQSLYDGSTTSYGTITAAGTGVGGAGTYYTQTRTVSSGTVDSYTNTETKWYCESFGQPGDVVKISTRQ